MIERQFVSQKFKESQIQEFMSKKLARAGYSHTEIHRTPLGEKIIVYTTRPGLVVGKGGQNIKTLTQKLKKKFKLDNPQIEIGEVQSPMLDVQYVGDKIAFNIERFGSKRFKSIGYRVLQDIMDSGALGTEIIISGKVPSARARSWRFSVGTLSKCGDIAQSKVKKAIIAVNLKSGTLGIKVSIMTADIIMPDKVTFKTGTEAAVAAAVTTTITTTATAAQQPGPQVTQVPHGQQVLLKRPQEYGLTEKHLSDAENSIKSGQSEIIIEKVKDKELEDHLKAAKAKVKAKAKDKAKKEQDTSKHKEGGERPQKVKKEKEEGKEKEKEKAKEKDDKKEHK